MMPELSTDLLDLHGACAASCSAAVVDAATAGDAVHLALDHTTFYPTGPGPGGPTEDPVVRP
jgi:hypothetical protein